MDEGQHVTRPEVAVVLNRTARVEQLAVKITGDIAIDHYRINLNWVRIDNGEAARTDGLRITHTWVRIGDTWQILGGMSAPVNSDGK